MKNSCIVTRVLLSHLTFGSEAWHSQTQVNNPAAPIHLRVCHPNEVKTKG